MSELVQITRFDVEVSGGPLACFRFGKPDATQIAIAVHGITSNSRAWLPVARALGDEAALVAIDLRGRGRSSGLPGPYGIGIHVRDLLGVIDVLGLERALLVGHSLGAYVVARLAASHPDRATSVVFVDGGLPIPGSENFDLDAFLGPALARLKLRFADRKAYREWWRTHPALRAGDVTDEDLAAYADHDLVGTSPDLRSSVVEEAVRADAADLARGADAAHRLKVPVRMLCAPRGLMNDPNPMQPLALARAWAAEDPSLREAALIPDVNHYTITLGARGAAAVAEATMAASESTRVRLGSSARDWRAE
jgi:pimeloyl-ACP methyl ester carboxylesterase